MRKPSLFGKQKNILKFVFTVLFLTSFVLILIEKNKFDDYSKRAEVVYSKMNKSMVKGDSIEKTYGIEDYRDIVASSLFEIDRAAKEVLSGQDFDLEKIKKVYKNLLSCQVPESYRIMHIKIVSLAQEILKQEKADLDFLETSRSELFTHNPWLLEVIK